jgi:hypothetical protein
MPRRRDPGFDGDVVRFVVADLGTVWALELLLLMRGAPSHTWTGKELTAELRANLGMVGEILERLEALGLVARTTEGWIYRPRSSDLEALCARTERDFREKPFAMISLIGRGERGVS